MDRLVGWWLWWRREIDTVALIVIILVLVLSALALLASDARNPWHCWVFRDRSPYCP